MEKAGKSSSSSSKGNGRKPRVAKGLAKRQRASKGASNEDTCGVAAKKQHLEDSESDSDSSNAHNNLPIGSRVYQFKITLKGSKPRIWRRIQVPGNYNFWELHVAIQQAMGWKGYHLHKFQMLPKAFYSPIGLVSDESSESDNFSWFGTPSTAKTISGKKVDICEFFSSPGGKANYEYDFGDGWEHTVLLEKIVAAIDGTSYPLCIAGKQACPPEDCGGIDGYKELLAIISNPRHKEYKEQMESLGGHFDPVKFDPKAIKFIYPKILIA